MRGAPALVWSGTGEPLGSGNTPRDPFAVFPSDQLVGRGRVEAVRSGYGFLRGQCGGKMKSKLADLVIGMAIAGLIILFFYVVSVLAC